MVEKERIITGTLEGIPLKCKIDSLNLSGGYFIDLKTMESLQSENIRRHFIVIRSLFSITL